MGLLETIATVVALGFLIMGFWGRNTMLNKNACQMTFTSHAKAWIEVNSSVPGVGELYRHPSKEKLNPQPVLFIHGHMGKADQVRSLSSPMHNDDNFFQYFAVDFKDNSGSAVHGSGLLTQAAFVNDAIRTILQLYASDAESPRSKKKRGVKVMLVGHSIGGMVARTAVMLSNHPFTNALANEQSQSGQAKDSADGKQRKAALTAACAVSDIIMLSTPNKAPPYSLDGSMHAVYRTVNQGWLAAHYNSSAACNTAREKMQFQVKEAARLVSSSSADKRQPTTEEGDDAHVCSLTNNTRNHQPVKFQADCSMCAPQIRLLSITGGDMDMHVPAHLTGLSMLHPRAHNTTHNPNIERTLTGRPVGPGEGGIASAILRGLGLKWTLSIFQAATQAMNPLRILTAAKDVCVSSVQWVRGLAGGSSGAEAPVEDAVAESAAEEVLDASDGISVSETAVKEAAATAAELEAEEVAAPVKQPDYSNYTYGNLMLLEQDNWDTHITPYVDSQHYSVRSQQLRECGFVVDHLAIVWCRQLVHAVSDAMRTLARNPSDLEDSRIGTAAVDENNFADARGRIKWDVLLPGRKNSTSRRFVASAAAEAPMMIPPVASFHLKNASNHAFNNIAPAEELAYISKKMNWGLLEAMAIWYVSNHLGSILAAYVFIGIMVLCVPLRRRVTNWGGVHKSEPASLDFSSMQTMVTLHLEDVVPTVFMIVSPVLNALLPPAVLTSETYKTFIAARLGNAKTPKEEKPAFQEGFFLRFAKACIPLLVVLAAVLTKVGYVDVYGKGTRSLVLLADAHKGLVAVFVSYYVAVVLRFLVCISLYGVRFILGGIWYVVSGFLYKKLVPKVLRKLLKRLKNSICAVLPPAAAYLPIVAASISSLLAFFSYSRCMEANVVGGWEYAISVVTVGIVGAILVAHVKALFLPSSGSSEFDHLQTSFALLYLPVLILAAPSTIYSVKLIFADADVYANAYDTFIVFSAERLNFLVGALGIFLQWTVMTHWSNSYAHLGDVAGFSWLISALGRPAIRFSGAASSAPAGGLSWDSAVPADSGDKTCCHEDGGRFATFEEVAEAKPEVEEVAMPADRATAGAAGDSNRAQRAKSPSPSTSLSRATSASDVSVQEVSKGVLLGCTYRVVHCECFRDKWLKDASEWCEFCLCQRCGMKNLPKDYYADKSRNGGSKSTSWWGGDSDNIEVKTTLTPGAMRTQYPHSANQVLLLGLLCVAVRGALWNYDLPHQQFTYLGGVAWSFLARDYLVYWRVLQP